jgi:hypothetical protein
MSKRSKIIVFIFWILIISGLITYILIPKWKVYRNEEFGFELLYPDNLLVKNEIKDNLNTFTVYELNTGNNYFNLYIEPKSKDYKDPKGPFPIITKDIHSHEEIDKDSFNGIDGYSVFNAVEGGGGIFKGFYFTNNKYIWTIDLNPNSQYEYSQEKKHILNKNIQDKIKNSFRLIK